MTPSIYTVLWGQVTTPDSISAQHTDTLPPTILTTNGGWHSMPRPLGHIYSYSIHVGHPPQQDDQVTVSSFSLHLHEDAKNDSIIILFIKFTLTYEPL